ncbi:hypothetical protein [Flammeovirga sp. SubArs3]|uniref:hypothetical protein n=1 Tax=Flammeovirga sp. SubArs3 TaxID=2995316 RepID=UPI00248CBBCD|nr:hypothetical protein [Flammeovirga sp. SubArs3]
MKLNKKYRHRINHYFSALTFICLFSLTKNPLCAQTSNISSSVIYKIDDEGLLDKVDVTERKVIRIFDTTHNEHWHFFFEDEKLIAINCPTTNLHFLELKETKKKVFFNEEKNIKLFTMMNDHSSHQINIHIPHKDITRRLVFTKADDLEVSSLFKKISTNYPVF